MKKVLACLIVAALFFGLAVPVLAEKSLEEKIKDVRVGEIASIQAEPTDLVSPIRNEVERVIDIGAAWMGKFISTGTATLMMRSEREGYASVEGTIKDFKYVKLVSGYILGKGWYLGGRLDFDDIPYLGDMAWIKELEPGIAYSFSDKKVYFSITFDWRSEE